MSADLHHLAAAYVLDAVDDVERRQFENHYPSCDICTTEVREFTQVAAALASSVAAEPPASLKGSIMNEVAQTRQLSPRVPTAAVSTPRFSSRILLAAAAALIVLAGVVVVTLPDSGGDRITEVVESSDAVAVPLEAQVEGQAGELRVVWSDELDQVVIEGTGLGDAGEGQAYALWFLLDEGVAPAGLFSPEDGSISTVLDVDDLPATGWGISIEPDTGSDRPGTDQPTTPVLFAGTFDTA